MNSFKCDQQWRHYLREIGVDENTYIDEIRGQKQILNAMEIFFKNESIKDFSKKHDIQKIEEEDNLFKTMDLK